MTQLQSALNDLARGNKQAWDRDLQMAKARVALDADRQIGLSLDPGKVKTGLSDHHDHVNCAVCGPECAAQVAARYFGIA